MTMFARGIAAAAVLICLAVPASAQNLGGRYQVIGKNPNGSAYSGTAEIIVTSANTCRIEWVTGGTTSRGICMRNGIAFSAGYSMGNKVGLVIYEIKGDGTLEGLWTVADQEGVGGERLVPMR
jgi:hypothetical protein